MAFRTLEISNAAEIHIKEGQLEISNKEGTVLIPIEDYGLELQNSKSSTSRGICQFLDWMERKK